VRIALVQPYAWDIPGGVQVHVADLRRALAARGHQVIAIGPSAGGEVDPELEAIGRAVRIAYHGTVSPISPTPAVGPLAVRLRAFDPDVVHVHEPFVPSTSLWATLGAEAPVVATFHSFLGESRLYRRAAPLLRRARRRLRAALAVSRAAESFLHQAFPDLGVEIVPNGLDVATFADAPPLAVGEGRHVAWVHRLDPQKGFPFLIAAWPEVLRAVPDARLLVAGDGPERGAVRDLPAAARDTVAMYGRVPHERVPELFRVARAAVAAAIGGESWGYTLVEAMAAGAPVVATDIDGYREVATDEVDALLVPPGEPHALAQALIRVLQDEELAKGLAARGRERAAGYDWDVVVRRIEDVYHRVLDG
jgi:phosphatidylinositol alpha-mannosyltransferase